MKTKVLLIAAYVLLSFAFPTNTSAQPAPVQKAGRSVFTLTTFKADGAILASTHGVFVGSAGEAVSSWKPFATSTTSALSMKERTLTAAFLADSALA